MLQEQNFLGFGKDPDDAFRVGYYNKVITSLRLTQERVEIQNNPSKRFDDFIEKTWPEIDDS